MTSKEQSYSHIKILVERFDEQLGSYKSGSYNETLTRRDFIDPFFKALGWDIDNEQGYAEAYREVIHEDKVKVGGATKAPDYSFRLGGGKRLFFVEAKKPSIVIKDDVAVAYQIRRYGWSAKLPISIITDFEEFAVYDCTVKPERNDKVSTARIKYITYKDYLSEFDFLWDIFSKERVLRGSFDRFVQSSKQKKGTATVDREFLLSLDSWRKYLATSISWNNKNLDEDEINYVVQQTINRIIFLRIAEDRGVEPYGQLKEAIQQKGDLYRNLFYFFRKANEKYNSGLFDFRKDILSPEVIVDNKVIKTIVSELYYPECPYEFSVLSVEILGSAYEQFLGKVIRLTPAHMAKIEEKPEVRKAGGVYYTPQYIVEYIVENTVGRLIQGKTPKEIAKLKIVDPACGSGSFLLGAYQFLLDYHLNYYTGDPSATKRRGTAGDVLTPDGRLTTDVKKRILLNNIHGVDIDTNAVEVTKLSLLLKCLEGETEASIKQQLSLWHERVLPTLENNIKSGNSLIDTDYYDAQLDFGEDKKIKPFNWPKTFPQVFQQGGFDVVIGNPPYVRQELLGEQKRYFETHYGVYHGVADLYSYFIEKGIGLLNEKGLFGIIVANKWMRANYGEPLRKWLKKHNIIEIIDFGDLPVFENVTTYPCILICSEIPGTNPIKVTNVKTLEFLSLNSYIEAENIMVDQDLLEDSGWNLSSQQELNILKKIQSAGIPLGQYVKGAIYYGIKTGLNEAFVIDEVTKNRLIEEDERSAEIIKPFLAGRDIKRYQTPKSDKYLIFTKRGIDINKFPAIKHHLEKFKKQLMPKPDDFIGEKWEGRKPGSYKWYEIQDAIDYYEEFEKPKIIIPAIVKAASYAIDYQRFYSNDKTSIVQTEDLFLLGILNSKPCDYLLKSIASTKQNGYFEYKPMYISKLSVPKAQQNRHAEIIKLVDTMLHLNQELQTTKHPDRIAQIKAHIDHTDERINKLVYELYGLTEEEIKIIEG
ncbi:MAG: Eco57I restriction-modification methylase domain-containing protein [Bacteroidetes bacterium]|nr:Eco57I restriction-modification methylase domain-containing protein [Bacteroidota bacterium]